MSATRMIPIDGIDQLDQIMDELRTIWLAMGNTTDMADDYLLNVREALNGTPEMGADFRSSFSRLIREKAN
jgi:hypothetical protein